MPRADTQPQMRTRDVTPPDGWRYTQPETGARWSGISSFQSITEKVKNHRVGNKLLRSSHSEVEDDIDRFTAESLCDTLIHDAEDWVMIPKSVGRSLSSYWQGTKAYLNLLKREQSGAPMFVSEQEAEARAAVCERCPKNVVNNNAGWLQDWTDEKSVNKLGGRSTTKDAKLHTCAVCTCPCKALVHYSPGFLRENDSMKPGYPDACWKLPILRATDPKLEPPPKKKHG